MLRPRHFPDLDRLSVLTAVIVLAYALTRVIDLPARVFSATVFGSPLNLALDGPFLIHVIVAALISTGAESLIRSHPYFSAHPDERALRHWILPGLTALVLGVALATVPDPRLWWLELGASVLGLLAVLMAEYVVVDPADARHDAAALALTGLTYALALTFFAVLYSLNYRALLSATLCGVASVLMALRAFTLKAIPPGRAMLYALLVGLIGAETFWAVTYWRITPGAAALLVMVPFYASVGVAQQHLMGRLTRRVWLEYLVVSVIGLAIALLYAWVWSR